MILYHAIGTSSTGSRLFVELLAEGVDKGGILFLGDGSVVAGEGLGCGVFDA